MKDYTKELYDIAKNYNTQLWAIPAVFFGIAGIIIQNLDYKDFFSPGNLVPIIFGAVVSFLLLLQFNKTSIVLFLIQKEINKYNEEKDSEKLPLFSISNISYWIGKMEKNNPKSELKNWEKCLAGLTTTKWVKIFMALGCIICVVLSVLIMVFLIH